MHAAMMLVALLGQVGAPSEPYRLARENWELSAQPMLSEVPLIDESTGQTSQTDGCYLAILIVLKNKSASRVLQYTSWGNLTPPGAFLEDDQDHRCPTARFGTRRIDGSVRTASIQPGGQVMDILAFPPPAAGARSFNLRLRGANIGESENLSIRFPATALETADRPAAAKPAPSPGLAEQDPQDMQGLPSLPSSKIALPSGKEFDRSIFDVDLKDRLRQLQRHDSVVRGTYANDRPAFIASHTRGVLDGGTFAFDTDGKLMMYGIYKNGKRDGFLRTWEGGRDVYLCQFSNGSRHGFCCFTDGGGQQLLVEYRMNRVEGAHLVTGDRVTKSYASFESARGDTAFVPALDELEKSEQQLMEKEREIRKSVDEAARQQRNKIVSQLNPQKRAAIQERSDQKAQERQRRFNEIRRRASGL